MKFVRVIDIKALVISILFPLAVGGLSAGLSGNNSADYDALIKPALSPPGYVFPIVWTVLFILMGISSYLIWDNYKQTGEGRCALIAYAIQLFLNFSWSIIFFGLEQRFVALIVLLLLTVAVVTMFALFADNVPVAAALQIPYLIWCFYALYLNYAFWSLNR